MPMQMYNGKRRIFINVRNAILIRLKYQQYIDNVHVDKI